MLLFRPRCSEVQSLPGPLIFPKERRRLWRRWTLNWFGSRYQSTAVRSALNRRIWCRKAGPGEGPRSHSIHERLWVHPRLQNAVSPEAGNRLQGEHRRCCAGHFCCTNISASACVTRGHTVPGWWSVGKQPYGNGGSGCAVHVEHNAGQHRGVEFGLHQTSRPVFQRSDAENCNGRRQQSKLPCLANRSRQWELHSSSWDTTMSRVSILR